MPTVFLPAAVHVARATPYTSGTVLIESDTFSMINGICVLKKKTADGTNLYSQLPYDQVLPYSENLSPAEALNQATNPAAFALPGQSVAVSGAVMAAQPPGDIFSVQAAPIDLLVTGVGTAGSALTLTLPAIAGRFHAIYSLRITLYNSAARTGGATPVTATSTNLNGAAWTFPSAGAIGTVLDVTVEPSAPIRSQVINTATTIVLPATTGVLWRATAAYRRV